MSGPIPCPYFIPLFRESCLCSRVSLRYITVVSAFFFVCLVEDETISGVNVCEWKVGVHLMRVSVDGGAKWKMRVWVLVALCRYRMFARLELILVAEGGR